MLTALLGSPCFRVPLRPVARLAPFSLGHLSYLGHQRRLLCSPTSKKNPSNSGVLYNLLQLIDQLATSGHLPIHYLTAPKQRLLENICCKVSCLVSGNFSASNGINCSGYLGPKGIGKSTTLHTACVALTSMMIKQLIPFTSSIPQLLKSIPLPNTLVIILELLELMFLKILH